MIPYAIKSSPRRAHIMRDFTAPLRQMLFAIKDEAVYDLTHALPAARPSLSPQRRAGEGREFSSRRHLHIRSATPADLPALLALYVQLHPDGVVLSPDAAEPELVQLLNYEGSAIFVGFVGAALVTSCALVMIPNLTRGALCADRECRHGSDAQETGPRPGRLAGGRHGGLGVLQGHAVDGGRRPATWRFYGDCGFSRSKSGFQLRRVPAWETTL